MTKNLLLTSCCLVLFTSAAMGIKDAPNKKPEPQTLTKTTSTQKETIDDSLLKALQIECYCNYELWDNTAKAIKDMHESLCLKWAKTYLKLMNNPTSAELLAEFNSIQILLRSIARQDKLPRI